MLYKKIIQFIFQKIRHLFYLIWVNFFSKSVKPNLLISIDIIIPIIEKDLVILPLCLEGLKNNVSHKIENIYIIAPDNKLIKEFTKVNNLIFVDENTVLGYSSKDINYTTTNGLNRSGWIFQQLLKLSGRVGTSRYYLVIDADHVLIKPHVFITDNNLMVFYQSSEFHFPYYKIIYNLIRIHYMPLFSFVSHKMIFDKEELKKLQQKIEICSRKKLHWDEIILSSLNPNEPSCFSEFELYGNYIEKTKKILLPWRQKALKKNKLTSCDNLKNIYSKYWSVTFPSYLNNR